MALRSLAATTRLSLIHISAISEVISAFTDMINGVDGADEAFAGAITGLVNTACLLYTSYAILEVVPMRKMTK